MTTHRSEGLQEDGARGGRRWRSEAGLSSIVTSTMSIIWDLSCRQRPPSLVPSEGALVNAVSRSLRITSAI